MRGENAVEALVLPTVGAITVSKEIPPGFYRDASGELKRDRRQNRDHGSASPTWDGVERRSRLSHKTDYVAAAREHDRMIVDALEEFATQQEC